MQSQGTAPLLRWGISGAGAIARRFCRDVNQYARGGRVVAIAARDQGRADEFARELGLGLAYGSYQALAESPEVEAVYVAVIHPQHAALIRQMLLAGKHVLVEKPAVTRLRDWDALVALAHERGLLLLEAMKVMCFPAMRALLQRLPLLPAPRNLRAAFGSAPPRVGKLFDPALDGGAAWVANRKVPSTLMRRNSLSGSAASSFITCTRAAQWTTVAIPSSADCQFCAGSSAYSRTSMAWPFT